MRSILWVGAAALMLFGVANAQSSGSQTSSTHSSEKAGAMPGSNVSGATSAKGKGSMPENPNAKKGTMAGTAGSGKPGSGPKASGNSGQ